MDSPGVLSTLGLAVALAFALPVAVFGATMLVEGRLLGVAFLGLAGLMVLVRHVLTTPGDLPQRVLAWATGRVVGDPERERRD